MDWLRYYRAQLLIVENGIANLQFQKKVLEEVMKEMTLERTAEGKDEALSGTLPIGEVVSTINDDAEEKS